MLPSICSSLSIPLVAFLDGETGDSYFDSNSHPLLVLSSSSNASKDKTNPSAPATYHLFASKLVHDPKDKDAVKYLSSCALLKDNACWEGFSADLVQTNAIAAFAPYSKTFTTSASTKSFLFPPLFVVLNEAITPGASPTSRSVCVVRHSLNSQAAASMFLKSPWAIAWRQGILMIDYTLRSVIWVSLKTDSMGQQLDQWTFSRPITTLWAPSDNAEDQLVLQSARTLYAVSISSMKIETHGPSFDLCDDEVCHQILWSTRSQGTHSKSRPPYLAVSTSSRVLMLDESLHLLQSYEIPEEDSILSMSWMGMSLLFLSSSGVLRYMLPSSLNSTTAFSLKWNAIESHGIAISDSLDKELMSLPREMGSYSLKSLVSMLPDRAIFNYTETNSETSSSCNFITKPFIPLEPLVMGLLWQLIQSVPEDGKLIQADIAAALRAYVPSKSASNIVAGTPSMQCSLLLVSSLYCAGLVELAAFAAGMDLSSSQPDRSFTADGELPSKRWLPPALRYEILKSLGLFKQAVGQLLSPYPDALELFLDSEAMTTAALPRLSSAASLACSAAACDLFRLEKHQLALRLADIAGNDSLLATMLQKLGRQSELDSFLEIVRSFSYIHYLRICKVLTISPEKCSSEPLIASAASVGVEIRRPSLLSKNFSFHSSAESDPLLNDNERPIPQAAKLWDGLGAVSRFGVLAMDSVEEWIGTQMPETFSSKGAGVNGNANTNVAGVVTDANSKLKAVKDVIPSNWVEDVGVGKDWELCAGYWRFSDLVRPGEADFISSLEPNARMNFSDLSKYATPLELFCASASDLAVEVSSSSVDPGEDHEKVKSLNDVVFHQEREAANDDEKTAVSCGLRAIVSRGGPLDIGMFHTDPNRSRMSLEMWVCRSEKDRVPVEATLVSRRLVSPSSGGTGAPIWTLFVSPSGELCFLFNSLPERVLRTGEGSVNMGPSEDVPVALWSHIALTVDTSHSTTAHVSLFINGDLMAESMTMALPELPESELARTVMFVGPDLSSWRLTEFRIWACSRSAADIRNDKDVYLSLASKRRRLQHRIKGGKRLFLAMGSLQLGEPGVSSAKVGESQPVTNPTTPALMLSAPSKAPRIRASLSPPVKAPKLLSPTARGKPVIMKETPNEKVTQEIGLLSSHGLTSGDIVSPSLISRPHALPHAIVLCKGEEIVIVNIEPPSTLASVRYKLAAESAILCPRKDRDILALFSQRKLIVFDIKTRKKLAEQPIATQLLFWKFITFELILLVTPLSIYTWSIHPDSLAGTDSRPQKLCSLTSLSEDDRVKDGIATSNYVLISLCSVSDTGSSTFRVIHKGSGKSVEMSAYAAQLVSVSGGLDVIYAVLGPVSSSGTTPSCRLCCLAPIQGENGLETETRWSQDIANSSLQWSIFRCSESSPGHLVLVGHDDGCVYSFSLQSNQLSQLCVLKGGVLTAAWEENSKFISLISRETGAISTVGLSELP